MYCLVAKGFAISIGGRQKMKGLKKEEKEKTFSFKYDYQMTL